MKPYFQNDWSTLYCGDCRDIIPSLEYDTTFLDPVPDNPTMPLRNSERARDFLKEITDHLNGKLVICYLPASTDPRFLNMNPIWPFAGAFACFGYNIAYCYGERGTHEDKELCSMWRGGGARVHPCPADFYDTHWLLFRFGRGVVLDPLAGIGTTLLAARVLRMKSIGIEIEERFCELAARRLDARDPF